MTNHITSSRSYFILSIPQADLNKFFKHHDTDNSGTLDPDEMGEALKGYGLDLTGDQVKDIVSRIDPDHSGEIDFLEFFSSLGDNMGGVAGDAKKYPGIWQYIRPEQVAEKGVLEPKMKHRLQRFNRGADQCVVRQQAKTMLALSASLGVAPPLDSLRTLATNAGLYAYQVCVCVSIILMHCLCTACIESFL